MENSDVLSNTEVKHLHRSANRVVDIILYPRLSVVWMEVSSDISILLMIISKFSE